MSTRIFGGLARGLLAADTDRRSIEQQRLAQEEREAERAQLDATRLASLAQQPGVMLEPGILPPSAVELGAIGGKRVALDPSRTAPAIAEQQRKERQQRAQQQFEELAQLEPSYAGTYDPAEDYTPALVRARQVKAYEDALVAEGYDRPRARSIARGHVDIRAKEAAAQAARETRQAREDARQAREEAKRRRDQAELERNARGEAEALVTQGLDFTKADSTIAANYPGVAPGVRRGMVAGATRRRSDPLGGLTLSPTLAPPPGVAPDIPDEELDDVMTELETRLGRMPTLAEVTAEVKRRRGVR